MVRKPTIRRKRVVDETDVTDAASEFKKQQLKCHGEICIDIGDKGETVVTVDRGASPECAKLLAERLLQGQEVRFNIVEKKKQKD